MGLDLSLQVEKPTAITDISGDDEKRIPDARERSKRLSLMFMRMSVANNIKSALPYTESAKEFMKFVGGRSETADKSLAGMLMDTLTTMKFDGARSMHEHVIEMTNIVARLKSLRMNVDENILLQFIINSLPFEYGPFQMNCNTMKDKWNDMLAQEETRFKNQGTQSIHLVTNQGAGKKAKRKNGKGKRRLHKVNESSSQIQEKEHNNFKCRFCGKQGHSRHVSKKSMVHAFVCFESNLVEVPNNTWIFVPFSEGAISWKSTKHSIIATSTMEAEFVARFEATVQGN